MSESAIGEMAEHVRKLRLEVSGMGREITAAREQWALDNALLLQQHAAAQVALDDAEQSLRDVAVANYAATGVRKPAPGVEVKLFKVLSYNKDAALEWARKHDLALQLDVKKFEAIAPEELVTRIEEPRAQLAKNLGATDARTE